MFYSANTDHTLFKVLQKVIHKHLGLEQIVESVLTQMGDVSKIILIGDYALGHDTGTIEIILIGDKIDTVYLKKLQRKLKDIIERTVLFYINSPVQGDGIELYDKNNSESSPNH